MITTARNRVMDAPYRPTDVASQLRSASWIILVLLELSLAVAGCKPQVSPSPDLVVENVRLLNLVDGTLQQVVIVIAGDRIEALHVGNQPVGEAVQRIDAGGGVVIPGLIDRRVHLLFLEFMNTVTDDSVVAEFIRIGLPEKLSAFLAHGVTTLKTTGDYFPEILAVREAIASGELLGPRVFTAGPVFTAPGGHPATACRTQWCQDHATIQVQEPSEARANVRRLADEGVDAIKVVYGLAEPGEIRPSMSSEVLAAIIAEARHQRLRVTVHTWTEEEAMGAVLAGAHGLEHGVVPTTIAGTELPAALRDGGISYVPTLTVWPHEEQYLRRPMDNLLRMSRAGVRIVLGSDQHDAPWAVSTPGSWTIDELERMVEAGLTPGEALLAATENAALHLGISDELGTIEPGKLADLVVFDGNPHEDFAVLRRPRLVILGGRVVIENPALE